MTSPRSGFIRLSEHLFRFRDTCEVYLVREGDRALLVDAGSAAVLDHLDEIGVREVEWVLHTHHHRDQCQGDDRLVAGGTRIAVPAREAALFDSVEAFWRLRRQFDDYDASSLSNTRARSIPVARRLADYETFEWRGHRFRVEPTPGHTRGSVTYLADIDGRATAFSGDLIAAPGHVDAVHDLQWQYATPDAIGAALHSVVRLRSLGPERLLPSHGEPMDDPAAALDALEVNLRELYQLTGEIRGNKVWTTWPHSVDQPKTHILPHLWANTHSLSNTYALIADDGEGLLLDYGFAAWDHFYADQRFVAHSLDDLRAVAGLRTVSGVVPSHYHDDHLAGIPWLQRELGAQAYIFENFADIVARPADHALPCLLGEPIRVDHVLEDGGRLRWRDWEFDVFHMPGHTWWALGLAGEVDGTRVALTGDNLLAGALSPLRTAAPIFRNRMRIDSIAEGVRRLLEYEPELLLTGHTGALPVTRAMLDDFIAWARRVEGVFRRLVVVPERVNEALDPRWTVIAPYRTTTAAPATVTVEVRVTELGPAAEPVRVTLDPPPGWAVRPAVAEAVAEPDVELALPFELDVPAGTPPGRHVITADVTLGPRHWGQLAEAWIDIVAEESA